MASVVVGDSTGQFIPGVYAGGAITFDAGLGGYTWTEPGSEEYLCLVTGADISYVPGYEPTGTVTAFYLYDGSGNIVYSITGGSVGFADFLEAGQYDDPAYPGGEAPVWAGAAKLLLQSDQFQGSERADGFIGWSGDDTIYGHGGADDLNGEAGNDVIYGGDEDDLITGGSGDDTINGDAGDDRLSGTMGLDTINGGAGDDRIAPGTWWSWPSGPYTYVGGVIADGGADTDYLLANFSHYSGNVILDLRDPSVLQTIGDGSSIVNIERFELTLGSGDDTLYDGALDDEYYLGAGNDTVHFSGGESSSFQLGEGNDHFYWTAMSISGPGPTVDSGADFDTLRVDWSALSSSPEHAIWGFELAYFTGSSGSDTWITVQPDGVLIASGGDGADDLRGGSDEDQLSGDLGDDDLYGRAGGDILEGGAGLTISMARMATTYLKAAATPTNSSATPTTTSSSLRHLRTTRSARSSTAAQVSTRFDSSVRTTIKP